MSGRGREPSGLEGREMQGKPHRESPKNGDELLCEGGGSLMGYLDSTLAQLRDQKVCQSRKYQLRRATGGA